MTIRYHSFAGRRFRVQSQAGLKPPDVGECDDDKRIIKIPIDGNTLAELDWIIHEALHACFPWMAEWIVDLAASSLARLLWRLGWRKE